MTGIWVERELEGAKTRIHALESQLAAETARAYGLYEDVVMYGCANGELKDALADEKARADDLATTLQGTLTSLAAATEKLAEAQKDIYEQAERLAARKDTP